MAEVDAQAYAVTSLNAAAGASNSVETQQPGGSGALRQTMVIGDPTTRANMATVQSNGSMLMQGYQPAATTFSGIVATGAQTSTSATGYNVATVTLRTFTGTTPSITFSLQASDDNTNWVTIQGINNATGQVASTFTQASALTAGTAGPSIDFTIGAYTNVRINVTAISGASATAAFGLALQTMPYEASPGAIAQGVAASASAVAGNPVLIGGSDGANARNIKTDTNGNIYVGSAALTEVTGSVTSATTLFTQDVSNYRGVSLQFTAPVAWSGVTVQFEISNDNTNWQACLLQASNATVNPVSAITAIGTYYGSLNGHKFFRARVSAYTSGTVAVTAEFNPQAPAFQTVSSGQGGTWTVQPGNTANTTPWLIRAPATTTSSGLLVAKVLGAANTTPVQVKTTAGQIYGWHLINTVATIRYVRIFNVSSSPTMGTTSPTFVLPLPASGGAVLTPTDVGIPMGTGFFYSITTGAADLDNTAPAANDVVGTFFYI